MCVGHRVHRRRRLYRRLRQLPSVPADHARLVVDRSHGTASGRRLRQSWCLYLSSNCPSATACTAVGTYFDSSGNYHLFLLTKCGSSWTAATAPLPALDASANYFYVQGIACRSATVCVATGWYGEQGPPSPPSQGLLLTRRGSSWTAARPPLPAGADAPRGNLVWAVACGSATACTAVGSYAEDPGIGEGLLLTWHRWSWTAARGPVPAGAATNPYPSIRALACPSATTCTAGGNYFDSSASIQGLLVTRHRWSWMAARAPVPAGAATNPETYITGIACPSATACTAIGSYNDSSAASRTAADQAWFVMDRCQAPSPAVPPPAD